MDRPRSYDDLSDSSNVPSGYGGRRSKLEDSQLWPDFVSQLWILLQTDLDTIGL